VGSSKRGRDRRTDGDGAEAGPVSEGGEPGGAEAAELAPAGRLLADLISEGITRGLHTPDAFVRRFPAEILMQSLVEAPGVRARILAGTVGLPEQTAGLVETRVAAEVLDKALFARDTSPAFVLEHFPVEDRVRHLPWPELWAFLTEGQWWRGQDELASGFMRFLLERASAHGLLDPGGCRDALGVDDLVKHLPRALLENLVKSAATLGARGLPLDAVALFRVVTPADVVRCFELAQVFDRVVVPLAQRSGYLGGAPVDRVSAPAARQGGDGLGEERAGWDDTTYAGRQ
jgi:hypothetical protein